MPFDHKKHTKNVNKIVPVSRECCRYWQHRLVPKASQVRASIAHLR